MRIVLLAALFCGCAHTLRSTPCGLLVDSALLDDVVAVEADELIALQKHTGIAPALACEALQGWEVRVHKQSFSDYVACNHHAVAWSHSAGFCIVGYTHSEWGVVEVGEEPIRTGALAHELIHVIDNYLLGQAGHCHWDQRGIRKALFEVTGVPDNTQGEATCPVW